MKKHISTTILLLAIITLSSFTFSTIYPNHPIVQQVKKQLQALSEKEKEEKVYVQLDRNFYKPGEAIWFSLFIRNANTLTSKNTSGMAYVELLSPKGDVLQKQHLVAIKGNASGLFQLPHNVGGIYTIKAYTNWQKNKALFFERTIQVQNPVLPNLNMKLDFARKAYGAGDRVEAKLELKSLDNEPLAIHGFQYNVMLDGKKIQTDEAQTDVKGKANIFFELPKKLETNDGLLNVLIKYSGQTESISRSIPIVLNAIDLQFFAEGGDLVNNIETKLAFKAINEFGKAADISGQIVDEKDQLVTTFSSFHNGMGALPFKPDASKQYFAKITKPEGIKKRYALPTIKETGYVLNIVSQDKEYITAEVKGTSKEVIYLIAQANDKIYFSKDFTIDKTKQLKIPIKNIPIGITKITLLGQYKNSFCERLVFVNPHKRLSIKVKTNKEKYLPREKVVMDVEVTNELGEPVEGRFSLAVADDKLLTYADDKQGHILSNILLESELKGEIEEPNFYFDEEKPKRKQALDYLMMTNGWRRFEWKEVIRNNEVAYEHKMEQAIIAGIVLDEDGKAVPKAKVSIKQHALETITDEDGCFEFKDFKMGMYGVLLTAEATIGGTLRSIQRGVNKYDNDLSMMLSQNAGMLAGEIKNKEGIALENCEVKLTDSDQKTWTLLTDKDGGYAFHSISTGSYSLELAAKDYFTQKIEKVQIKPNKALQLDSKMIAYKEEETLPIASSQLPNYLPIGSGQQTVAEVPASSSLQSVQVTALRDDSYLYDDSNILLDVVMVTEYKVPLIEQDNTTSGSVVKSEQISRLATKDIGALASMTAGLSQVDEGDEITIRGSRSSATEYYIDGIRVSGNLIPASNIDQIQVMTGGIPASFGGGTVRVSTPRSSSNAKIRNQRKEFMADADKEMEEIQYAPIGSTGPASYAGGGSRYSYKYWRTHNTTPRKIKTLVDELPRFYDKECEAIDDKAERQACANQKMKTYFNTIIAQNYYIQQNDTKFLLRFWVDKDGEVGGVKISQSDGNNHYYYRNRIQESLYQMHRWIPAVKGRRNVASYYTVPINLQDYGKIARTEYTQERQFYSPMYQPNRQVHQRRDFRSTIYWNPNVVTNEEGKAQVMFCNSDATTTFRTTIEGFGNQGQIGRSEYEYFTQLPFAMHAKSPALALSGDQITVPLTLTNNTEKELKGTLNIPNSHWLELLTDIPADVVLAPKESQTIYLKYRCSSNRKWGNHSYVHIGFTAKGINERFYEHIRVKQRGYPVNHILSDGKLTNTFDVSIEHPIDGSLTANFQAHPNLVTEMTASLDRLVRQPSGCFEQTTSKNYPNVLALQVMDAFNITKNGMRKKIEGFTQIGYQRLKKHALKDGGFTWYGRGEGHPGLTAYALMQFYEMNKVLPAEDGFLATTAEWLLDQKDGKGSWKRPKGQWGYGNQTPKVGDAYIVWTLCEAGYGNEITKEIEKSYTDAVESKDAYIMGLMVNALYKIKDNRADALLEKLMELEDEKGLWNSRTTITRSGGNNAKVETTALAIIAMAKRTTPDLSKIERSMSQLSKFKNNYGYGSTQSTVLALKALVSYAYLDHQSATNGIVEVFIDGKMIQQLPYRAKQLQALRIDNLENYFTEGKHRVSVKFHNTQKPIPFEMEIKYTAQHPKNSNQKQLDFKSTLATTTTTMGETVRLSNVLTNTTSDTLANAVALVAIPSGLTAQPWQLKEIQEKNKADYYEIFGDQIAFHFLYLRPNESKKINLDLKADLPGMYTAAPSSAYLYYDNEERFWTMSESIAVKE